MLTVLGCPVPSKMNHSGTRELKFSNGYCISLVNVKVFLLKILLFLLIIFRNAYQSIVLNKNRVASKVAVYDWRIAGMQITEKRIFNLLILQ
jgi:hypothetical protein